MPAASSRKAPATEVFDNPQHPYTVGLLRSLPRHGVRKTERALATIPGILPLIGSDLPTCVFVDRCPLADDLCRTGCLRWFQWATRVSTSPVVITLTASPR